MSDEPEVTREQIHRRAEELWERNHRPEGMDIQFWLAAERELKAERDSRIRASEARNPAAGPSVEADD